MPCTVAQALREAEQTLAAAGVTSAAFDARCLVAEVVSGGDLGRLPFERATVLREEQHTALAALLARRAAREPLQYIVGYTDFLDLRLRCDRRALIPRPETELLAETVLDAARRLRPPAAVAADIGTGTGALALALVARLRRLRHVYATDISPGVLSLAAENARSLGMKGRITFLEGADLQPLADVGALDDVELLVTNPPYVGADELDGLQPEIRVHEPRDAVVDRSGSSMGFYRRIIPQLSSMPALRLFACEVGAGMAQAVEKLTREALRGDRWTTQTVRDYCGYDRVVLAHGR